MKKVLLTMVIAAGLYACGGESTETAETKPISRLRHLIAVLVTKTMQN